MLVASVGGGFAAATSFVNDRADGPVAWSRSLIPGFTVIFLAWVFGPLLLGGIDDALDPRRLALLPLRRYELSSGLAIGALVGFLPLGTLIALGGVVVGYVHRWTDLLVVLACATQIALSFSLSRLLAVELAHASSSRRGRDIAVVAASGTAAVLWLATQGIGSVSDTAVDTINRALRWTPPGMLGQAVVDVAHRRSVSAFARIAMVGAVAVCAYVLWSRRVQTLLTRPTGVRLIVHADIAVPRTLRLLARVAIRLGGPLAGAVFVKEARYLLRSPARRSALVVSTVMGVPFVALQVLRSGGFQPGCVRYAPAALLFGLGSVNNLIGADATSLWLELTSGARLRELLVGRGLAAVPYLVVPSFLTASVLAVFSRSATSLSTMLCLVLAGWGIPLGVGTYLSARAPFPQSDDQNPFSNTRAVGGPSAFVVLAVAGLGTVVVAVLALPVAWVAWKARSIVGGTVLLTLVAATYGTCVWLGGVRLAVRRVERRGIDLVSSLSTRQAVS